MPHSYPEQRRHRAIELLALCASGNGETLQEIHDALGFSRQNDVLLARRALVASLGCGNWREVRAEAEAKLRCGEIQP